MSGPLSPAGVDLSNETQAFNFMQEILDDSVFQPQSILYSVYFWYGTVVVIAIAAIINISQAAIARGRSVIDTQAFQVPLHACMLMDKLQVESRCFKSQQALAPHRVVCSGSWPQLQLSVVNCHTLSSGLLIYQGGSEYLRRAPSSSS